MKKIVLNGNAQMGIRSALIIYSVSQKHHFVMAIITAMTNLMKVSFGVH